MAKGGGSRGASHRGRKDAAPRRPGAGSAKPVSKRSPQGPKKPPVVFDAPAEAVDLPSVFVLGVVPGATPGKWIDAWRERMPDVGLELRPIAVADERRELDGDRIDAAIVRLPLESEGLHVIPLYEERAVVVVARESHLTAVDELALADLAGEVVVVPVDDVLALEVPDAIRPRFAAPETTADAIATVAAGVGAVIVPMSLARLHQRRDAASVPLRDGPLSPVALAWRSDRTTPLVEAFVGIVRGRTANSSRG